MSEDMDAAVNDALGQYQCISTLTAENERLRKRVAELRRALERYGEHESGCALFFFDEYDPDKGWKYGGVWNKDKPACTCGLNAALEDKP